MLAKIEFDAIFSKCINPSILWLLKYLMKASTKEIIYTRVTKSTIIRWNLKLSQYTGTDINWSLIVRRSHSWDYETLQNKSIFVLLRSYLNCEVVAKWYMFILQVCPVRQVRLIFTCPKWKSTFLPQTFAGPLPFLHPLWGSSGFTLHLPSRTLVWQLYF